MDNIIISIGRQFGCGGRIIGQEIAKQLNIEYYDKELMNLAAKEYGIDPEFFEHNDEKSHNFLDQAISWFGSFGGNNSLLSNDALFKMQSDIIKKISEEKSCVIVGRCSDYVLRKNKNCISIFLHSSQEDKAKRIAERMNTSIEHAIETMLVEDKKRANYYNFFSDKTWGMSSTYDLSIEVSKIGAEQTIEFILKYIRARFPDYSK